MGLFAAPLLLCRHRSLQLIKLLIIELLNRTWQIVWQDMPRR